MFLLFSDGELLDFPEITSARTVRGIFYGLDGAGNVVVRYTASDIVLARNDPEMRDRLRTILPAQNQTPSVTSEP